jgi:hypothetical protein
MGVSPPTYGTLSVFRQTTLTFYGIITYDPMGSSYAFSPIGFSGTTCGVGDTEACRFTTALKHLGGLGNGYLNRNNVDPMVGLRFRF